MTLPRLPLSALRSGGLVAAALVLSAVIPASAQVSHGRNSDRDQATGNHPNYVDSQDYDPQPYYVDGVQYKPYVPKKGAKPADATAKPAAAKVSQSSQSADYDPGELHPFVPASSAAADASASSKASVAAASRAASKAADEQASASSSAAAYVPHKRTRYGAAVIEALDKVTAESVRFEAPIGQPVRYKGLIYTVKACETTADDEPAPDVIAYMQVRTSPAAATNTAAEVKSKEVFHGWTFASAPSLNPVQHPVYDAWVIGCRRPLPGQTG